MQDNTQLYSWHIVDTVKSMTKNNFEAKLQVIINLYQSHQQKMREIYIFRTHKSFALPVNYHLPETSKIQHLTNISPQNIKTKFACLF